MSLDLTTSDLCVYPYVPQTVFQLQFFWGYTVGQLNDLLIKVAQPRESEYFLADGEGLYLRVRPAGKVWIYRYKYMGRTTKLSLGAYPTVSLSAARKKAREEAGRRQEGVDPRDARRKSVSALRG